MHSRSNMENTENRTAAQNDGKRRLAEWINLNAHISEAGWVDDRTFCIWVDFSEIGPFMKSLMALHQ